MITEIARYIPAIQDPVEAPSFRKRLFWIGIVSLVFLAMGEIALYGMSQESLVNFREFELILGSKIGTIATLGIGPIVTASIVLQLLIGSKIIDWNLQNPADREKYTAAQKILTIVLAFVEGAAYVLGGGIIPASQDFMTVSLLVLQIAFGGIAVMYLDEIVNKYGFGSGVSLFIALGVSKVIFIRLLNPFTTLSGAPAGLVFQIMADIAAADMTQLISHLIPIISTIIVFAIVVYAQDIKVEVPLALGSVSGFGRRWPLKFIYTSNMPVILLAALLANLRLLANVLESRGITWASTVMLYLTPPASQQMMIIAVSTGMATVFGMFYSIFFLRRNVREFIVLSALAGLAIGTGALFYLGIGLPPADEIIRAFTYLAFFMIGSVIFSILWVMTSGMDAESVAEQIESIGMQIPGFRRDRRIIEKVLSRYINVLTILGGLFVGLLAAFADFTRALGSGTGILLTSMIIYNFYEIIVYRYLQHMDPRLRRFFKK